VLICLPPSEGKTPAPDHELPVDLTGLSSPSLTAQRTAVLEALASVSLRPDATAVLGVSDGLAAEVARNVHLKSAPAAPASLVYTGVLYAAAGLADLPSDATARAEDDVRIFSGLWGAVAPGDRIPAYRLPMGVDLPGVGRLATAWRAHLAEALDERATGDVVVDCRSAAYIGAWKPATTGPNAVDWVTVRVVRDANGKRTVVSHNAKHTRGVLTGHLLRRAATPPSSAEELLDAARELDGHVIGTEIGTGLSYRMIEATLHDVARRGPRTLELVIA
jgi:cytoplasmic iron level regulating protein YaaA (DUF328/UPF0246 family)